MRTHLYTPTHRRQQVPSPAVVRARVEEVAGAGRAGKGLVEGPLEEGAKEVGVPEVKHLAEDIVVHLPIIVF